MSGSRLLLIAAAIAQLVQGDEIGIDVGEGGLYIVHPSLPASIGDVLAFRFSGDSPSGQGRSGSNYSVVQGTYDNPCFPLEGGFFSGFLPVPPGEFGSEFEFRVTVNTTDPLYYYCGQVGDCQAGMVGTVNAPYNVPGSFLDYQSAARQVTSVGPLPTAVMGGQLVQVYTYSTTLTSPTSASPTPPPQTTPGSSPRSTNLSPTGSSRGTSTSGSSSPTSTAILSSPTSTATLSLPASTAASHSSLSATASGSATGSSRSSSAGGTVSSGSGVLPGNSTPTPTPSLQPVSNQGMSVDVWNTELLLIVTVVLGSLTL